MTALGRSLLVLFILFLIFPQRVLGFDKYILEVPRAGIIEEISPANPFKINDYMPVINNKIAQATGTSKNLIYLFAHSSAFNYNGTKSKSIFATLDYVDKGDTILINRFGNLKKYRIIDKLIVAQTNLSYLTQKPKEETLVLQTCLLGNNFENRLIITAKPIIELSKMSSDRLVF